MSGWLLTDIALETCHCINSVRGGREGALAIKLDMTKAYHRVEWSCLQAMLSSLMVLDVASLVLC